MGVELAFRTNTLIVVEIVARAALIDCSIAVVVQFVTTDFSGAVCGWCFALPLRTLPLLANTLHFALVVADAAFVNVAIAVVV